MFQRPTVLILGAGAHEEFNMPLGSDLLSSVASAINMRVMHGSVVSGDANLYEFVRSRHRDNASEYRMAGRQVASVAEGKRSLDDTLDFLSGNEKAVLMGKIGIVNQIMKFERGSKMALDQSTGQLDVTSADGTWIHSFLTMATDDLQMENVDSVFDNLTVINFNYDRCFEHYMYWVLQQRYLLSTERAKNIVTGLNHIRPYGQIAPLEWEKPMEGMKFGAAEYLSPDSLISLAENIETYTEQRESETPTEIDEALDNSELVIMLGLNYHRQNWQLFKPSDWKRRRGNHERRVFTTNLGMAKNSGLIQREISNSCHARDDNIHLEPMRASDLLSTLMPSIMAAAN